MPVGIGAAVAQALLGAGFALRVFTPPELLSGPFWNALPTLLFAAALGVRGSLDPEFSLPRRLYWPSAVFFLFAVIGARFGDDQSLSIALELLGLWCFALQVSAAPLLAWSPVLLPFVWLGISGLAEATWLHTSTTSELQRLLPESAAALSRRAAGPFLNANVFAGALLFVLPLSGYWLVRGRAAERLLAACLIAGFSAAMSFGGSLALLLALLIGKGPSRWLRFAALALFSGAIALLVADHAGLSLGFGAKIASLRERWDYAQTAHSLLGKETLFGAGFGSYADLARDALTPGLSYSRHAHCGPLEWVIEGGLLFVAVVAGLMGTIFQRGRPEGDSEEAGSNPRALLKALAIGVGLGGGVAILQFPARAPFPASVPPLLSAALFVGFTALFCVGTHKTPLRIPRRLLALGVLAMTIHGVIDFDWSIAPHRAVLFLGLGILLRNARGQETARAAHGPRVLALLAAILAVVTAFALGERQRALADARALAEIAPRAGKELAVAAPHWPHSLEFEGTLFRHLTPQDLLVRFDALPHALSFRRSVREAAIAALLQMRPDAGSTALKPWANTSRQLLDALAEHGRHLSANAAVLETQLAEVQRDPKAAALWRARAAARSGKR